MKPNPLDNPVRNSATLRNLTHNFRLVGVNPWLEEITFDALVDAWWQAQARKAERLERETRRKA